MLKRWKNGLALILLLAVMGVSYGYHQSRLTPLEGIGIPVVRVEETETLVTAAGALDAIEAYRDRRQAQREKDMEALGALIQSEHTTLQAREDAQAALTRLVAEGEKEMALEGAMTGGGFTPCLCVVEGEQVTLMVGKKELTAGEANLLMTMAQSHAQAAPEKVMILTGNMI
ncbi:MAG: SpoIIIAH-like family protein [Clostridia bacterium]|nr:SpoIIIAH-like family protein [Clostridia bacterium]